MGAIEEGSRLLKYYGKNYRPDLYIALESMNFEWSRSSIERVLEMWNQGDSLKDISNWIGRDIDEVGLLIIDLGGDLFSPRSHGILNSHLVIDFIKRYKRKKTDFFSEMDENYLVFEENNGEFYWDMSEVRRFETLWKLGRCHYCLSQELKRDPFEITLLTIDRARKGTITSRPEGLIGRGKDSECSCSEVLTAV